LSSSYGPEEFEQGIATGIVHADDRERHAEHGHSHAPDSETEVQVGKKRQIVGILVSAALAQSPRGIIRF
jgi:hypothetical protein